MNIRLPDLVTVYTETGRYAFSGAQGAHEDVACALSLKNDALLVSLRAETTPVRFLRLRWHFAESEKRREAVRIYGDAWERGGGNLEWRGIVPERCMPWFFLVSNGTDAEQQRAERAARHLGAVYLR